MLLLFRRLFPINRKTKYRNQYKTLYCLIHKKTSLFLMYFMKTRKTCANTLIVLNTAPISSLTNLTKLLVLCVLRRHWVVIKPKDRSCLDERKSTLLFWKVRAEVACPWRAAWRKWLRWRQWACDRKTSEGRSKRSHSLQVLNGGPLVKVRDMWIYENHTFRVAVTRAQLLIVSIWRVESAAAARPPRSEH